MDKFLHEPAADPSLSRALAWKQLSRSARLLVFLAVGIALAALVGALVADAAHDGEQARVRLQLEAEARAHSLAVHLGGLVRELNRLGLHSEIDLLDENLEPERTLLRLSHGQSTFFNVGVALLDAGGTVAWSEPQEFLVPTTSFADESWFRTARRLRQTHLAPVRPERHDALLYVVSPVVRKGVVVGALIGGIDLATERDLLGAPGLSAVEHLVLSSREGDVIYPGRPPVWASGPEWQGLFPNGAESWRTAAELGGIASVVAAAAVPTTDLVLSTVTPSNALYGEARRRLLVRLAGGLTLVLGPLGIVVLMHHRTLQRYRREEEQAVRLERLAHLGSAANVIAHEVKNSLNGIRMGLDLLLLKTADASPRAVDGIRAEILRLTEFTTELLLFSRGIHAQPVPIDLAELTRRVGSLSLPVAADRGIELRIRADDPLAVVADPSLLHVVVSNLVSNAIDAASQSRSDRPVVEVVASSDDEGAMVVVRDDGPGVPAAIRATLFEPFVTGKPTGTGVGLAISRRIAEVHGGSLTLGHSSGEGATFILRLKGVGS